MNAREVLIAARKKIERLEDWWDGESSAFGRRHCAWSACSECGDAGSAVDALLHAIGQSEKCANTKALFEFNDTHTHAEVLAAFDRAIESVTP